MNTLGESLGLVAAMGGIILLCRAFPFLFFSRGSSREDEKAKPSPRQAFIRFVEKTVPPVAMTVLAFNALGSSLMASPGEYGLLVLAASVCTAILHLIKGNALISIFGGTALYMLLTRLVVI